jgi:hypothetical protein
MKAKKYWLDVDTLKLHSINKTTTNSDGSPSPPIDCIPVTVLFGNEKSVSGCSCYDWQFEMMHSDTFIYNNGWNMKAEDNMLRRIYFCPMCGKRLEGIR